MTHYVIYHRLSDRYSTDKVPNSERDFAALKKGSPFIFDSLTKAKTNLSRTINECTSSIDCYARYEQNESVERYRDWLQFLSGTEIVEVELTIKPDKVAYAAITKIGASRGSK
jgi:hypothetical protein